MAGHVDFRDDRDLPVGRVADQVFHLLPGVMTLDGNGVELGRTRLQDAPGTIGADLRQARIGRNRDPPSLVLGQVPVEDVDPVQGHDIQEFFQIADVEIVTTDIHHEPAVGESRGILDRRCREGGTALGMDREGFVQGLRSVEDPFPAASGDVDAVFPALDPVAFFGKGRVDGKDDPSLFRQGRFHPRGFFQCFGEQPGSRFQFPGCLDGRPGRKHEGGAFLDRDLFRQGADGEITQDGIRGASRRCKQNGYERMEFHKVCSIGS